MKGERMPRCRVLTASNQILRSGRTLVETLTVIGLVLMITGMAFPVFVKAMEGGRHRTCASHLRSLGLALRLYAETNDDRLPLFTNDHAVMASMASAAMDNAFGNGDVSVLRALNEFEKLPESTWYCPSDPHRRTDRLELGIHHRLTSYRFLLVNVNPDVDEDMFDAIVLSKVDPKTALVMDAAGTPMLGSYASVQREAKPVSNHPDGWVNFVRADFSLGQISAAELYDRSVGPTAYLRFPNPN